MTPVLRQATVKAADRLRLKHAAWLWIASLQYYIVQLLVAAAWPTHAAYSWNQNTISDLANTHCAVYGQRLVCSPLHNVMNISFIILGITMVGGAVVLRKLSNRNIGLQVGLFCFILAGIGTIIVGLFPENTIAQAHVFGAALPFIFGNIALLLFGAAFPGMPRFIRIYTIALGVLGLFALVRFVQVRYYPFAEGGLERIVAYPQSLWMISFGLYLLRTGRPTNKT